MALGAPRPAKAGIANPGRSALPGKVMGGGSQGNTADVQNAHALPPSRNGGAMSVLVQRAYFSAWRMVCGVPSAKSAGMRPLPCGLLVGGLTVRSYFADTSALPA